MTSYAITTALALSSDDSRDYGEDLRTALDAEGVTDLERLTAVGEVLELAREILACAPLDDEPDGNILAGVLDKMLEAAGELVDEIAAMREP